MKQAGEAVVGWDESWQQVRSCSCGAEETSSNNWEALCHLWLYLL